MRRFLFVCLLTLASCMRAGMADGNASGAPGSITLAGRQAVADDQAVPETSEEREIDFGPIFSIGTDAAGNRRWRALGPLFERSISEDGKGFLAVRPFYSRSEDLMPGAVDEHIVWPLWIRRITDWDEKWSVAQIVHWYNWGVEDEQLCYTLRVLPIYFQGRDEHGQAHWAIFPLGGNIRNFLGQDEWRFALFPLYLYHRVNEVETTAYVWPIYSRSAGGEVERFSLFPFYGMSKRGTDYYKYYIMWPFWTHASFGFEQDAGYGYVVFPLFGHSKLDTQESFFFIPPLIRFTKSDTMDLVYCPWPFYQRKSGVEDKLFVWPLWGRKSQINRDTWFLLWPLILGERHLEGYDIESRRFIFLPVFFRETRRRIKECDTSERLTVSSQVKVWPLASYQRDEDRMMFRAPSLWPFRDYRAIDRNYAPFWTLYSRTEAGPVREDELLWGLFRYRRSDAGAMDMRIFPVLSVNREEEDTGRGWSFLKGLLGYERSGDSKSLRLLYFFNIGI